MPEDKDIIDLWKSQPIQASEPDMQLVIDQAAKFQRQIRFRNLREYLACGVLVVWNTAYALKPTLPPVMRAASVLLTLGVITIAVVIRKRAHAAHGGPPLTAPTGETLGWHRSELVRQRDLVHSVPIWYLGPLVPGMATMLIGAWLLSPAHGLPIALTGALCAVVFIGIVLLNRRAARKLDLEIAEVDRALEL
jgi:hypothetical protein